MDAQLRDAIRGAGTWPELRARLAGLEPDELDARGAHLVSRALARLPGAPELRAAFLGNHTLDPLPHFAAAAAACRGLRVACYTGAFDQHFQEVLDPASGLARFEPELILLSLDPRIAAPRLAGELLSLSPAERRAECAQLLAHVRGWVEAARARTRAVLLVCNFPRPLRPAAGIADAKCEAAEAELYAELELALLRELRPDPRACVFDLEACLARAGRLRAEDAKLWYVAKMRFAEAALPALAEEWLRFALAAGGRSRKALVLDLDHTLWGGVVGEDGPLGVRVGGGDPVSEAYRAFQLRVRALRERGVILALCSKNNPEDAREVFDRRPEMPLAWHDFAARRINWEPKHENLRSLAEELRIGLDALVFVDDNPVECELVRQLLPEVRVIQLPRDPALYADLLSRSLDFEQLALTEADLGKTQQYAENARREDLRRAAGTLGDFLESLGTRVEIGRARPDDLARAQQLFAKTNQFNVTTRRHSLADVERFAADPRFELCVMRVQDRFGDLGLVGLSLVEFCGDCARLDSLVLSCRAMGRGVETALLNCVKERVLASGRCARLLAEYLPTRKNPPVAELFESQGFRLLERAADGRKRFELCAGDARALPCPGIEIAPFDEEKRPR